MATPGSLESIALGMLGGDWIDGTGAITGRWSIIMPLTDCVVNTITQTTLFEDGATTAATLAGKTLPKGIPIYCQATSITLTSGTLIAYRSP